MGLEFNDSTDVRAWQIARTYPNLRWCLVTTAGGLFAHSTDAAWQLTRRGSLMLMKMTTSMIAPGRPEVLKNCVDVEDSQRNAEAERSSSWFSSSRRRTPRSLYSPRSPRSLRSFNSLRFHARPPSPST